MNKLKLVRFDDLCRKCWKMRKEEETFYGFNIVDDFDNVIEIRGHKECVDEMNTTIEKVMNPFI